MALLRKSAAALCAAAAVLLAIPPTASATPAPYGTLARENFDRLPLGPVTEGRGWTADTADGTLSVAPSATGHGRELRIRTEGNGRAFLVFDELAPPGNSFWGRVRLRVGGFPTAPDWAHWTIAEASGAGSPTPPRLADSGRSLPAATGPADSGRGLPTGAGPATIRLDSARHLTDSQKSWWAG